jgi:hypothetical protein
MSRVNLRQLSEKKRKIKRNVPVAAWHCGGACVAFAKMKSLETGGFRGLARVG